MRIESIRTENLKYLVQKYGGNKKFSDLIGKSPSQVTQWTKNSKQSITGKPTCISSGSCRAIEKALSLPDGWMDQNHAEKSEDSQKRDIAYLSLVPIRGSAKLGESDNWFVDLQYPAGHGDGYIKFPSTDKDAYAVRCEGDSMSPRIRHGEFAIIEPNREVNPGDEVLVQSKNGQVMVKVFSHKREGRAYFESINDGTHKPFSLPLEEIESMQYVAGTAKSALKVE